MKISNFLGALALGTSALLINSANAAVYIVAHADDMQLMMAQHAIADIKGGYPTVVVIVSAGDAGNLNMPRNPAKTTNLEEYNRYNYKYYRVRMDGHVASLQTWIPTSYSTTPSHSTEYFSAAIPSVEKTAVGNVLTYYLNIPEPYISLLHQYGGSVRDVEGINTYTRESLKETIRQIISRNNRNTPALAVNYQEPNPDYTEQGYNELSDELADESGCPRKPTTVEKDHGEHTSTGLFVKEALAESQAYWCVAQVIYMGYAIKLYPQSFPAAQQESGYMALHTTLANEGNQIKDGTLGAWDATHTGFFGRQKSRLYAVPGGGTCAF
jgi:hypothetical protein